MGRGNRAPGGPFEVFMAFDPADAEVAADLTDRLEASVGGLSCTSCPREAPVTDLPGIDGFLVEQAVNGNLHDVVAGGASAGQRPDDGLIHRSGGLIALVSDVGAGSVVIPGSSRSPTGRGVRSSGSGSTAAPTGRATCPASRRASTTWRASPRPSGPGGPSGTGRGPFRGHGACSGHSSPIGTRGADRRDEPGRRAGSPRPVPVRFDQTVTPSAPLDRSALVAAAAAGARATYVPFWNPELESGADVGPGVLSQWWPAGFTVDGKHHPTAEHWMMAEKARLFGDLASAEAVLDAATPAEAKALGREVRGFDSARWSGHRFDVVVAGNGAKFGQNPRLAEYLLTTGDAVLVEASPVDRIWGIGLAADDPGLDDPARWPGENLLGFALMVVRERLRT